jgi:N-formylglutamate amidohydrolase
VHPRGAASAGVGGSGLGNVQDQAYGVPMAAPVPLSEVFERRDPDGDPVPLLVEVPRSGRLYPADFRATAPFEAIHAAVSMHVDDLFAGTPGVGGTYLVARFPSTYIDANRGLDDLDPTLIDGAWPDPLPPTEKTRLGVGLVRALARPGVPMYDRRPTVEEIQHRIRSYHEPYHREIASVLDSHRRRFGAAWHVSAHCMAAVGSAQAPDPGKPRPDFCIGDRDGTTSAPAFVVLVVETLRARGYHVTVNDPYQGAECVRRHGVPARGVHSLQIETNKRLFMDETTFVTTGGYARLRADLDRLLAAVAEFARGMARGSA